MVFLASTIIFLLEYLAYLKADKPVPKATRNDRRLNLLNNFLTGHLDMSTIAI